MCHLWLAIENQFLSNREHRTFHLDAAFHTFVQDDLSVIEYFRKFKAMADGLADLDAPVDNRILVLNILRGLNQCFKHVGSIIRRYSPFPNFRNVRDDLLQEELHMDSTKPPVAPTALYTNIASSAAKPPSSTPSRPPHSDNSSIGGNWSKYHNKNLNSGNGGGHNGKNNTGGGGRGGSMEFDPFDLSVKDLTIKNVIVRSNSTNPLYTIRLPRSLTPSSSVVAALAAVPHTLTIVAPTMWHRHLGHPGPDALSSLSRSSFVQCTSTKHDFCHAGQLGKHTRLPFCSSSHHAEHPFDLIHLDLWTSPIVCVSGSKYYLVILDDYTHYLWTFLLKLKSDTFTNLSHFFTYVSTQFGRTVKAIQ
jgi:hypothetical protein